MGKKHAKNVGAAPVFRHAERKRLKWGTVKERIGGDSLKSFDMCSLCLHRAETPMTCPEGHLFCKACVYEALLMQKEVKRAQLAKYNAQQAEELNTDAEGAHSKQIKELLAFDAMETAILPATKAKGVYEHKSTYDKDAARPGYVRIATGAGFAYVPDREAVKEHFQKNKLSKDEEKARSKYTPSFWLPTMTPDAGVNKVKAPSKHTSCPAHPHTLRLKQLRPVKFTVYRPVEEAEGAAGDKEKKAASSKGGNGKSKQGKVAKAGQLICCSCRKTLTNSTRGIAVMKKCGHVMCGVCVDRFVKVDKACVECGAKVKSTDIIRLQEGGTSFSAHGGKTVAAKLTPAFQC